MKIKIVSSDLKFLTWLSAEFCRAGLNLDLERLEEMEGPEVVLMDGRPWTSIASRPSDWPAATVELPARPEGEVVFLYAPAPGRVEGKIAWGPRFVQGPRPLLQAILQEAQSYALLKPFLLPSQKQS